MLKFTTLTNPSFDQIRQIVSLYQAENWWTEGPDNPDLVARIVSGSHCFLAASVGGKIIGMGRAISDGTSDAYIQDVTVDDRFRGENIGSEIVKKLVRRLLHDGLSWIGLIAERNSHRFYEHLGFKAMPDATPLVMTDNEI